MGENMEEQSKTIKSSDATTGAGQISPDSGSSELTRAGLAESLGICRPSGDLEGDLKTNKRVLLERGISIRSARSEPDMGENIVQFIACTEGIKRDGNRVRNDGWSFDNFAKNPQFLWAHDYSSLPICKHGQWKVDKVDGESVLRLWSQFCSEDLYPFADKVRKMYEQGFLRAGSIGWIPLEYETIVDKNGYTVGFDFLKNDLLEFSAVPVPSDPNALIEAVQRGVLSGEDMEKLVQNKKRGDNLGVSYRLSNQNHLSDEVAPEAEVASEHESDSCVVESAEDLTEVRQEINEEIDCEDRDGGDSSAELSQEEERLVAETPDHEEVISEDRGDMEDDEKYEDSDGMPDVKEELVAVLQEASKDFTTKIISAVMSVLGDSKFESSLEEDGDVRLEDEALGLDGPVSDVFGMEAHVSEDACEELEEVDQRLEQRIGAKVSKSTKDRLCRCRDNLSDVVRELDKMLEERKKEDDSDMMEVEVPEKDETTLSVGEDASVGKIDWGRATEIATRIQEDLNLKEKQVEGEEAAGGDVKKASLSLLANKAQDLLDSIGKIERTPNKSVEIKSDYLKKVVDQSRNYSK